MEYMPKDQANVTSAPKVLCCECGLLIDANPSNMCINCLKTRVDITEGITKQVMLYFCKGCEKYLQAQGHWIYCPLESRELLSLCLKKIKGLNKIHLTDASFIWTEPHSKRLKVKLTIQKEVFGGAILQQSFVVEYVVQNHMCENCHRREANDFWRASVQLRQKTDHKKTFYFLEQILIKHRATEKTVNIKANSEGIDFFFDKKDDAKKLVEFLQTVVPCRFTPSQQLISHDVHSNVYNYKHSFCVEIVPICKDDIVCLPQQLAASLGNIGQICICLRVTNYVYLIDPFSLKVADLSNQQFWRFPFRCIANCKMLSEYTVMNVEYIETKSNISRLSDKHVLADVWVVKTSELGINDAQIHTRTHIGHLLSPGDSVLGFDLGNAVVNDTHFEKYEQSNRGLVPDVVIVKKYFGDKLARNRRRIWKLKRLEIDEMSEGSSANRDFMDFLDDLEEDPQSRTNVNIYRDSEKMNNQMAVDTDEINEELPQITLQEMLDDLVINDVDENNEDE